MKSLYGLAALASLAAAPLYAQGPDAAVERPNSSPWISGIVKSDRMTRPIDFLSGTDPSICKEPLDQVIAGMGLCEWKYTLTLTTKEGDYTVFIEAAQQERRMVANLALLIESGDSVRISRGAFRALAPNAHIGSARPTSIIRTAK